MGRPHEKLSGNRDLKDKLGLRRSTMRDISILGAGKKPAQWNKLGRDIVHMNCCHIVSAQ